MLKGPQRVEGPINHALLFWRGDSFLYASHLIKGEKPTTPAERERFACVTSPYATSMTFATELYLKVLRNIECGDNHLSTHDLTLLFGDLPEYLRDKIEEVWEKEEAKLNWSNAGGRLATDVMDALKQSAWAFVDFRYETEETITYCIDQLPYILRWAILAKRPDWKPRIGTPFSTIDPHATLVKSQFQGAARFAWPPVFNHKAAALKA